MEYIRIGLCPTAALIDLRDIVPKNQATRDSDGREICNPLVELEVHTWKFDLQKDFPWKSFFQDLWAIPYSIYEKILQILAKP